MSWQAIGIFDSGVGGLTVLREIDQGHCPRRIPSISAIPPGCPTAPNRRKRLPAMPHEITSFLVRRDIKLLVVACNTASAVALPSLKRQLPDPGGRGDRAGRPAGG